MRGAQKTDGYQANRNLVLDDQARADSIPGLEILADDVRCTHGATVGKLEKEPLFYLKSRGIPQADAERLVVEGFLIPSCSASHLKVCVKDFSRQSRINFLQDNYQRGSGWFMWNKLIVKEKRRRASL